ncbi:MAG: universal stress protein [Pseudomonadota bacterium]
MYLHILLATDLLETCVIPARQARDIATQMNARLSIVHVLEPITTFGFPIVTDTGIEAMKHAKKTLSKLGDELAVAKNDQHIRTGSPKHEIVELALEISADLIVAGSEGRFGLSQLLGSTGLGLIHGSKCDVLIVKPPK